MPQRLRSLVLLTILCVSAGVARAEQPAEWLQGELDNIVKLYRQLHQSPELSYQEEKTAATMADELEALGIAVTRNVGGHGVVGVLENGKGPTLMLRADMDALPVTEDTNLVYASKVRAEDEDGNEVGVMHACGHDIHMANLIGTARYLASHKDQWQGTIVFIFQPAEERGGGAKAMLEDGLYERFPKPDFAVALHVDSALAAGRVGTRGGYSLANVDSVDITMKGRGGHGAYPHTTIDPIVQAAHLVLDLQTIVAREIAPTDPAVITVGSIHGGTKHNVIGDACHLQLTVRSYSDEVRKHLLDAIRRKAMAVAASAGAPEPTVDVSEGTPALYNDDELAARINGVFRNLLGNDKVAESEPSMGGEDFSRYRQDNVPITMFRLGSVDTRRLARYATLGQKPASLHSAVYYPDAEETLQTGIVAMCAVATDLLAPRNKRPRQREEPAMARRHVGSGMWLLAYALSMGATIVALVEARSWAIRELDRPEAQAEWQRWRAEEIERSESGQGPVKRRPPSSPEPPALVLLRDSFAGVVVSVVILVTVLFVFLRIVIRGMLAGSSVEMPRGVD